MDFDCTDVALRAQFKPHGLLFVDLIWDQSRLLKSIIPMSKIGD